MKNQKLNGDVKKVFLKWFLIILFDLSLVFGQWEPDRRLTFDEAASFTTWNNARCIAVNGDTIHVVWYDFRDGNTEIYYKRSIDGGVNWESDIRLTNIPGTSHLPSIAVAGSKVHVVWADWDDPFEERIYYKRSSDGGITWGPKFCLSNNFMSSPVVAVSGSNVHVVWVGDGSLENYFIYYRRSSDGGITWQPKMCLRGPGVYGGAWFPSIAVADSNVHVVWADTRHNNQEIYYKHSCNNGFSFEPEVRLTHHYTGSMLPSIAVLDTIVHIVWGDWRDGGNNPEVYYKRSTDNGVSWGSSTRLTYNSAHSYYPSIAVVDSIVHIVWKDWCDGNPEIYNKRSTDWGASWESNIRLTNDLAYSDKPSIAVSDSIVHVVWWDERDGNSEIYYKRRPLGDIDILGPTIAYWDSLNSDSTCIMNDTLFGPYPIMASIHDFSGIYHAALYWNTDSLEMLNIGHDTFLVEIPQQIVKPEDTLIITYYIKAWDGSDNVNLSQTIVRTFSIFHYADIIGPTIVWWDSLVNDTTSVPEDSIFGSYPIMASIYDFNGISSAILYWNTDSVQMFYINDTFIGLIHQQIVLPGDSLVIEYYIKAWDGSPNTNLSETELRTFCIYHYEYGIEEDQSRQSLPKVYALCDVYPNPSKGCPVMFEYQLPELSNVRFDIYDIIGRLVKRFNMGEQEAGCYQLMWDDVKRSGVYFFGLFTGDYKVTKKVVIINK